MVVAGVGEDCGGAGAAGGFRAGLLPAGAERDEVDVGDDAEGGLGDGAVGAQGAVGDAQGEVVVGGLGAGGELTLRISIEK